MLGPQQLEWILVEDHSEDIGQISGEFTHRLRAPFPQSNCRGGVDVRPVVLEVNESVRKFH